MHLANKIKDTEVDHEIDNYLPAIYEVFADLDKEELIKHMVSVEFNRFLAYYKKKKDISSESKGERSSEPRDFKAGDAVRYFINIGSRDNFNWMDLKDFLRETLDLGRDDVFKVDVKEGFSFFNTDAEHLDKVMDTLNGYMLEGRKINVEISKNDGGSSSRRDHNGRKSGGRREGGFRGERNSGERNSDGRKENNFRNDRGNREDRRERPRRESGFSDKSSSRRSEGRNNENAANRSFEAAKNRRSRRS